MPKETRFGDNFARLLGVHRLSAQRAADILGVSPGTISHWVNGRREPDTGPLYSISIFFLVDPWDVMTSPARNFLMTLGDVERFDAVEAQIAQRVTAATLEAQARKPMREGRMARVVDLDERMRQTAEGNPRDELIENLRGRVEKRQRERQQPK